MITFPEGLSALLAIIGLVFLWKGTPRYSEDETLSEMKALHTKITFSSVSFFMALAILFLELISSRI